jgi:hypothetical protein
MLSVVRPASSILSSVSGVGTTLPTPRDAALEQAIGEVLKNGIAWRAALSELPGAIEEAGSRHEDNGRCPGPVWNVRHAGNLGAVG